MNSVAVFRVKNFHEKEPFSTKQMLISTKQMLNSTKWGQVHGIGVLTDFASQSRARAGATWRESTLDKGAAARSLRPSHVAGRGFWYKRGHSVANDC